MTHSFDAIRLSRPDDGFAPNRRTEAMDIGLVPAPALLGGGTPRRTPGGGTAEVLRREVLRRDPSDSEEEEEEEDDDQSMAKDSDSDSDSDDGYETDVEDTGSNKRKLGELSGPSSGQVTKKSKRKPTANTVKTSFTKRSQQQNLTMPLGGTYKGKWLSTVQVSPVRSFTGQRARQVLRHLSTVLFHHVSGKVTGEKEVESMFVGSRLLISANDPRSVHALADLTQADMAKLLAAGTPASDERGTRAATKLKKLLDGSRDVPVASPEEKLDVLEIAGILKSVDKDSRDLFARGSAGVAADWIKSPDHANQIFFVVGEEKQHAEQHLVLAYVKSGSTDRALIFGKKRPCTGCYFTLLFARDKLGKNIDFNEHPGAFWDTTNSRLFEIMQQKEGLTIEEVDAFILGEEAKMYTSGKPGERRTEVPAKELASTEYQYDSDSGSEAEPDLAHT